MKKKYLAFTAVLACASLSAGVPEKTKRLSLKDFVSLAAGNDPYFQEILIDSLSLKYSKDLQIPARDLVLDVTGQYNLFLSDEDDDNALENAVSLSKLFPMTGTSVSAKYGADRYTSQSGSYLRSTASAQVSQSIAKNAFGRSARMLSNKIEIENSLARHQVAEAYEDYLASLMSLYMSWELSYRQMQSAEKSLLYNQDLLSVIQRRSRFRIAHPEEVDRMKLEVLSAKEEVITLKDQYERYLTEICTAAGLEPSPSVIPGSAPFPEKAFEISDEKLKEAVLSSRTMTMVELLRQAGILEVRIARDDLLPSAEIFAGINTRGRDYDMKDAEKNAYAGFSLELNFGRQTQLAEYETSRIELRKTLLSGKKSLLTLRQDIKNLVIQINYEKELVKLGETKTTLADRILTAERKNYVIGKTSLNDLIEAMNNAEQIRTATIKHRITLQQYYVEWKRISDTLVGAGAFKPVFSPELKD